MCQLPLEKEGKSWQSDSGRWGNDVLVPGQGWEDLKCCLPSLSRLLWDSEPSHFPGEDFPGFLAEVQLSACGWGVLQGSVCKKLLPLTQNCLGVNESILGFLFVSAEFCVLASAPVT